MVRRENRQEMENWKRALIAGSAALSAICFVKGKRGGGLLFATKEEEPGSRISDVRFEQLRATGANTVVTACPFCSIMLKGAQASAGADTQFVDLMTYVNGKLQRV